MTVETPAHELTRNPVDGTWGFICREHGVHRAGLTEPHALNVERKHLREDHASLPEAPALNLSEAARSFLHYTDQGSRSVWEALTGLTGQDAITYASELSLASTDATAAVVPL